MTLIQCKFNKFVVFPHNAISDWRAVGDLTTADGKECSVRWIAAWNNEKGAYEDEINGWCERLYGMGFSAIRSLWIPRLGFCDDVWHLVELTEK
jgi:hypothetical protein